jgi:regulator of sigma D
MKDLDAEVTANKRGAYDELGKTEIADAQEEYNKLTKEYNKALKEYNKNRTQANKDKLFEANRKLNDAVDHLHARRSEYNDIMLDAGSDEHKAAQAANKKLFGSDYKGDVLTVETNRS